MENLDYYLKKMTNYTSVYFEKIYFYYSNNCFDTEEKVLNTLQILDESFEKTKEDYKLEMENFIDNLNMENKGILIETLNNKKIEIEQDLKKRKKMFNDAYELKDYIATQTLSILFYHVGDLIYRIKKDENEKKVIWENLCMVLSDKSVQYERDIRSVFIKRKN